VLLILTHMTKTIKILIPVLVIAGAVLVVASKIPHQPPTLQPVEAKTTASPTPKKLTTNLSPARGLVGTWKSALPKKGIQISGTFTVGPGTATGNEYGDVELIIDSVKNNIAYGKVRFTNMCATVKLTIPKMNTITNTQCTPDTGFQPQTVRVSSSALIFNTISVKGATVTMSGSYTTDIMTGNMTMTMPGYGVLKGTFHLIRQ
jgi:hypothetical protein